MTLVVLPEENPQEYEEVLRGLRESLQPYDATEDALVSRLAQAHWRGLRSRRVETGMLHITAATQRAHAREIVEKCPEHLNPHNAIAVAFMTMPPDHWQTWLRYDTTISREFFRTLDTLTRLQRIRKANVPAKAMAAGQSMEQTVEQSAGPAVSPAISRANSLSESGIRSVSQNGSVLPHLCEQQKLTYEPKQQSAHGSLPPFASNSPGQRADPVPSTAAI